MWLGACCPTFCCHEVAERSGSVTVTIEEWAILGRVDRGIACVRSLLVEVVDIKPVEVSYDACLSSGIEGGTSEFFDSLIFAMIKSLEAISSRFIKGYLAVISSSHNVGPPS